MTYRPKRIAAPRLIFDAASALVGQVEASGRIDDDDRDRWYNAITKAAGQLMDGTRFEQDGDDLLFPSRTRSGIAHRVNGTCTCEAGEKGDPCWHRAAKRMIALIVDVERTTLIDLPDVPPSCPRCGAELFERNGRQICPACQHSRQSPMPPAKPRPAISAEQAMREIDELYG
jgi:SWIM zinc finger